MSGPGTPARTRTSGIDETLLARMTGRAGDPDMVRGKAAELAGAVCEPLEQALSSAGLAATVTFRNVDLGLRTALEATVPEVDVRCPAAIGTWCPQFTLSTSAAMAIVFAESLLGGGSGEADAERPLSTVELDISVMLFEQLLDVVKRVAGLGAARATAGRPVAAAPGEDEERPDVHSAMITLEVRFGQAAAPLRLLLPQETILRTVVVSPAPEHAAATPAPPEWAERLTQQVRRSNVVLRARIRLAPMTLGDILRLQPGDTLAFADARNVDVRLDANGRHLARCELGRSGSRYMLRLKPGESLEAELVRNMP